MARDSLLIESDTHTGTLTPVNKFSGKQSPILSKFSETLFLGLWGKRRKISLLPKQRSH